MLEMITVLTMEAGILEMRMETGTVGVMVTAQSEYDCTVDFFILKSFGRKSELWK